MIYKYIETHDADEPGSVARLEKIKLFHDMCIIARFKEN